MLCRFRVFLCVGVLLLAGCTGRPDGVEPVTGFDVSRYVGTWYEIARLDHRFERGLTNVTATYALSEDGTVSVVNRGYKAEECVWDEVEGVATFQGDETVASLSVTFFWPFSGGYHVFELDQESYQYAAVAGPTRAYLWILARDPNLAPETRERLIAKANDLEFDVNELILVEHGEPVCGKN